MTAFRPIGDWTPAEALAAAEAAYLAAPEGVRQEGLFSEARRQARHAKTERRLAGIARRDPELGEIIQSDLEWLGSAIVGFRERPIREQIGLWYRLFTLEHEGDAVGLPSRRGNKPTNPSHRAAAFVLLDWRAAQGEPITTTFKHSRSPSVAVEWLALHLAAIDERLSKPSRGELPTYEKMAAGLIQSWREAVASGAHP